MVVGVGEQLPYRAGSFDYVLMMTVICFLEDPGRVLRELYRVLRPGGILVTGFIEDTGELSLHIKGESGRGLFLRHAKFRTAGEVSGFLRDAGFATSTRITRARGICVMSGWKPGDSGRTSERQE